MHHNERTLFGSTGATSPDILSQERLGTNGFFSLHKALFCSNRIFVERDENIVCKQGIPQTCSYKKNVNTVFVFIFSLIFFLEKFQG